MRKVLLVVLGTSALLAAADARAQQVIINDAPSDVRMPFPGMGPRQFKTGTARIRGRVVSAETGTPVRRAQVRIAGADIGSRTSMTDTDGQYEFRDLPGGTFNLSATKSGYVTVQYGQTRPFEAGKPIELTDGQLLDKADIGMPRGCVISGRVLDEFGDPVADAMVSAMRSAWSGGRRRLQPSGRGTITNDLGQFRIYGLSPGEYYVSATLRGGDMGFMEAAMGRNGAGGPSGSNPTSGYAPTYFPGTANGAEAQKITLTVGQEAQNTDFALLPVRLARITGTVISSEGHPVEGSMVNAIPRSGDIGFAPMMGGGATRTDRNGNFTLSNVTPGDYTLQTRALQITTSDAGDSMMFMARVGGPNGGDSEIGSMPISVAGEDLSNVVIVTAKGATATGRVIFEGAGKPNSLTGIRITAAAADSEGPMPGPGGSGAVKADGTFELRGLSGLRIIRAVNLPAAWMLKEVQNNGADVTDSGIDLKGGETLTGLEVVLTSKVTAVSGTVKGTGTQQVNDYTLVVFSDDPQRWLLPTSRYVVGRRPDQDGRFQVKGLPPGGYYAVAVDYLPQGDWNDPEVLERLKPKATSFSLDDGETKTLDLKIQ
jgi:protocatechuate 3,4-dioxygenase beta subunit